MTRTKAVDTDQDNTVPDNPQTPEKEMTAISVLWLWLLHSSRALAQPLTRRTSWHREHSISPARTERTTSHVALSTMSTAA